MEAEAGSASTLSKAVGVPPRWTWPRTVARASWPVLLLDLALEPICDSTEAGVTEGVGGPHRPGASRLGHRTLGTTTIGEYWLSKRRTM